MGCACSKPASRSRAITAVNNVNTGPKGVSVHYLKHQLLKEVNETEGLSGRSSIYQLEDWSSPEHGLIRGKGADVMDPNDGRSGSSYVDALSGKDNVGTANLMLSYTWGYAIEDIVVTLDEFCRSKKRNPKSTYVWICFLCINQHRVFELNKNGKMESDETFATFKETFESRVTGVGEVACMMSPWEKPKYLNRVWCVFELYTAYTKNCKVSIIMPNEEREKMANALSEPDGIDVLIDALMSTNIQNTEASVAMDKERILGLVQDGPGFQAVNNFVNDMLRDWVKNGIMEQVATKEATLKDPSTDTLFALFCGQLGIVMERYDDLENALTLNRKSLVIFSKVFGEENENTASAHHNVGRTLQKMEKYDEALLELRKVLAIDKKMFGDDHPETAPSYTTISEVLRQQGKYDEALIEAKKGLKIRLNHYGEKHHFTAMSYGEMGLILHQNGDYESAIIEHEKSLNIYLEEHGDNHPQTATVYHNIGGAQYEMGDYNKANESLQKALEIRTYLLGADSYKTKDTLWYLSKVKENL